MSSMMQHCSSDLIRLIGTLFSQFFLIEILGPRMWASVRRIHRHQRHQIQSLRQPEILLSCKHDWHSSVHVNIHIINNNGYNKVVNFKNASKKAKIKIKINNDRQVPFFKPNF